MAHKKTSTKGLSNETKASIQADKEFKKKFGFHRGGREFSGRLTTGQKKHFVERRDAILKELNKKRKSNGESK